MKTFTVIDMVRTYAIRALAFGVLLMPAATTAKAQDYNFVKGSLEWSSRDHGFNEGAVCGVNALQGVGGIQLPNVPFQYQILGNAWDRTNMMGAAQTAFNLGYVDAAVNTAICSQIHNQQVHDYLALNRALIVYWFSHR